MASTRQLGPIPMLGLWAGLCFAGILYGAWQGYGGRDFAATVTAFCFLFLVALLFAARGFTEFFARRLGPGAGWILGVCVFLAYLIYALGTNSFALTRAAVAAAIVFVPLVIAASARGAAGAWQDFFILAAIWVVVKFGPVKWLWPYPGGRMSYVFTVLFAVNIALATFVLLRRLSGTGYTIGWGPNWTLYIVASFLVFACISIPLGIGLKFVAFAPRWSEWHTLPLVAAGILFFTAWPEELLFRGLLQNMLSRASNSEFAGWWTASVLFGFSHIPNGGFPNWRYVLLASIAGMFYGWTWRKTGSIFASAIVHAAVDVFWHFLFRTL